MSDEILSPKVIDRLSILVEESTRASKENIKRFIEPESGTLQRATSQRHHIIFGRRGSGKTSLLLKAADDLAKCSNPIAYVDLEPYKGLQYPDVLISVLIASFNSFNEWLNRAVNENRKPIWKRLFLKYQKPKFNIKEAKILIKQIIETKKELQNQLFLSDNAELQETYKSSEEYSTQTELGSKISLQITKANSKIIDSQKKYQNSETREKYRRSKRDFLFKKVIDFRNIFKSLSKLSNRDSYLFLDDLYHIRRPDQAQVIDYFHRIAKGNNLWLKIGTIRHRSEWYIHSDPPMGLKLDDDANEINLDLTLENFYLAKKYLISILQKLANEVSTPPLNHFLANGAIDRLVIASGGVVRDFLAIFRRSINQARERLQQKQKHTRRQKIGAEDVNLAVGNYGETKLQEFKLDTLEDRSNLEDAFQRLKTFCLEKANANCFLFDQDDVSEDAKLIDQLVDLRLIHLVRSRVTVSGRAGKIYKAFLLDFSQYTGARKRRFLKMVEFWSKGSNEELRRISFIYEPNNVV